MISHQQNDAFILINRLLKNGDEVYWLKKPMTLAGRNTGAGTIFVPAKAQTRAVLQKATADFGVTVEGVTTRPSGEAFRKLLEAGEDRIVGSVRRGSMTSGWLRWIFEQSRVSSSRWFISQALDQGDLATRFDVLVFPSGAMPRSTAEARGRGGFNRQPSPDEIPEQYRKMLGNVTIEKTVPQLRKFVDAGGTIVTIGDSTELARLFGLPVEDGLTERTQEGRQHPTAATREILRPPARCSVGLKGRRRYRSGGLWNGVGGGCVLREQSGFSPKFPGRGNSKGIKPVLWFPNATPLRSGWAWGQGYSPRHGGC